MSRQAAPEGRRQGLHPARLSTGGVGANGFGGGPWDLGAAVSGAQILASDRDATFRTNDEWMILGEPTFFSRQTHVNVYIP